MQNQAQYQPAPGYQQPMANAYGAPPVGYGQPQVQPQVQPIAMEPLAGGRAIKKTGLEKLEDQRGVFIKQKVEMMEVVTGCETENKYYVYPLSDEGLKKGKQIFKCKEKSGFCSRQCLSGDCRPFKMTISTMNRGEEDDEYTPFLQLERPCKCTCLCFARPELLVTLVEGGRNEYIGKIVDPWNCCNLEVGIYDKDNTHRYSIEGSCCQLGLWCKCPCEPCQTIDFDVKVPSGEVVSALQKRSPGCLQAAFSDADRFALNFPSNATVTQKALLMCAVLLIDFRHFEQNPNNRNQ